MNIPQQGLEGGQPQQRSFLETIIYGFVSIAAMIILITLVIGVAFKGYLYPLLKAQIDAVGMASASSGAAFVWTVLKIAPFAVIFAVFVFLIIFIFRKEREGGYY